MGASPDGAEMTTFLAPPFRCLLAPSTDVKTPVHSTTMSAPAEPQGISSGFILSKVLMLWPLTSSESGWPTTSPWNLPCVLSYVNMYAMYSPSMKGSLIATSSTSSLSEMIRATSRPMRPKPLMPTRIFSLVAAATMGTRLAEAIVSALDRRAWTLRVCWAGFTADGQRRTPAAPTAPWADNGSRVGAQRATRTAPPATATVFAVIDAMMN
mmetsp:Transcript_15290/g.46201  ORF Transcript_15290/g.46201 Transcript_15290/m.46201 type:complete len:211 (+) Transcript_15290:1069-1701(+)